ncbi:MAG: hypothetical protein K2M47_02925 [Clostridiales bacterium]|nr:hypothetical protein [Clostridiales bacterium]
MGNFQNGYGNKCPICGKEDIDIWYHSVTDKLYYYGCPTCGNFFAPNERVNFRNGAQLEKYNTEQLKSYLFYNPNDWRAVLVSAEDYEKYITDEYVEVYNLTPEMVENWYPKNFNEKIDLILLQLDKMSKFDGDKISLSFADLALLCFTVCEDSVKNELKQKYRLNQIDFILETLVKKDYITWNYPNGNVLHYGGRFISLTANGLARVDDLQKTQVNNKNVFVAMKFGEETQALREKIKEGLKGYNARIMDEIEHNHQIVPEMLFEIRNSKFVIAELSNHNNGAYYEAGYALGLGKEVIHICKKSEMSNGLHFDVAQVNTIVYDSIDEIPEKLKKRIQATIS